MEERAEFSLSEGQDGGIDLMLSGPLIVASVGPIDPRLRALDDAIARIDISAVSVIDTVGAWCVRRLAQEKGAEIVGASHQAKVLIDAVAGGATDVDIHAKRDNLFRRVTSEVGKLVLEFAHGFVQMLSFLGAILAALGGMILHPSRLRMLALTRQFELVAVTALPIIGLMSFLVGIVIAQQGAVQLRQFGAEVYTVNLTGRLALRELGVLMTAIMVAGRSGSAFAAQIGTMKLTEEVDAMRTIGVSPIEALVIPRVLAAVLLMPLLGFYAAVSAIIGGAFVAHLTLDIPFFTFLSRIQEVVPIHDLWVGLIKAPVFGLIVALAGCYQGMQVSGNSEAVGLRTTKAVVQGIFMVIVLDAFFAVFFTEVGWG